MELKPFGVLVSVCYPPDTDTPGYKEGMPILPLFSYAYDITMYSC